MVLPLLDQILQALTGSQVIRDKVQRNEWVIRLLKQFGLDPDHPPADFEGAYNYALVEYGVGKPSACLEIFRQREIRSLFRAAFGSNDPQQWLQSGEAFLAQSELGRAVKIAGLEPKQELAEFAATFIAVVQRSQMMADVLLSHQMGAVQQQMQHLTATVGKLAETSAITSAIAGSEPALLAPATTCRAAGLADQIRSWFEILGYRFESYERWEADYFEWVIDIPVRRGRYDRILVRGIDGEAGVRDVRSLTESIAAQKTDEGWLVTARRISQAARTELEATETIAGFTLDELLDQDADFSGYVTGLKAEIERRRIRDRYVPLACTKEEVDPITHQRLGLSHYGEADGWTEGYIDRWLDDPAKEHLSVLGEFGTGKTWLTLHYAAIALEKYETAKNKGMTRPRLPIVIPLRDYAKAVSVESLFSEFFFRKHEIPIPGYSAFEQLNRMGKLLLIFDGFDEMAARVDKQQMINNFWELAKVVVPGSKVILTCRTEHFPEAKEGRSLLNAELQASTKGLTGETPQFEVLELEKFDQDQIRQVLSLQASEAIVEQILNNPSLLDLARRPVMTELILEALPEIEAGKPVDMSRVYLYAVRRKMERDIKAERTFTSLADKLYFLCELSWEMLSHDRMTINYREFPDRIRRLFGAAVQEEKDLDHWHYDMMGQTMLIRNADGDYTPAHRSLLEFFVAYKFAAELGVLAPDFLELAQMQTHVDTNLPAKIYRWSEYFGQRERPLAPLQALGMESVAVLRSSLGAMPLTKAVKDLMVLLLQSNPQPAFWDAIALTRHKTAAEVGYLGGNAVTLLIQQDPTALISQNLAQTVLQGADFTHANLRNANLTAADLSRSRFTQAFGTVLCSAISPTGTLVATGEASGMIHLWSPDLKKQVILNGHGDWVRSLAFTSDGSTLISTSSDQTVKLWNVATRTCFKTLVGHYNRVYAVALSPDDRVIATCGADRTLKVWDLETGNCLQTLIGHEDIVWTVAFSDDPRILISSSRDRTIKLWNWRSGECVKTITGKFRRINFASSFKPIGGEGSRMIASDDEVIQILDLQTEESIQTLVGHSGKILCLSLSPDQSRLVSSSYDQTIRIWDLKTGNCLKVLEHHTNVIRSVTFDVTGKFLFSGSDDRTLCLWNVERGELIHTCVGNMNAVNDIALSPDGTYLVHTNDDETMSLWDLDRSEYLRTLQEHTRRVWSVDVSRDGKFLVSASSDRKIKIWDFATGTCLRTLACPSSIFGVAISPDSKMLLSSGSDMLTILWDMETGQRLREVQQSRLPVSESCAIALSQDWIAASAQTEVNIWNRLTGDHLTTLSGHLGSIWAIAISPDEQWIATGSFDTTVKVWDIATGNLRWTLEGHTNHIRSIVISLDGTLIASAGDDAEIRIWNGETGICQTILRGHQSRIRGLAVHPNGEWLVSGSFDETIRVWDLASGDCIKKLVAKRYAGMNITAVKGLGVNEIATLKALGAVEEPLTSPAIPNQPI
jgi:WD40 repeat protein